MSDQSGPSRGAKSHAADAPALPRRLEPGRPAQARVATPDRLRSVQAARQFQSRPEADMTT